MTRYTHAARLLVLAALGMLVLPMPAEQKQLPLRDRIKASSRLHYELLSKRYDQALEAMVVADDIDFIEPVTGRSALALACGDESADAIDMVRPLILQYGAKVSLPDWSGFTPLHHAATAGNMAVVRLLLDSGANVNAATSIGLTPLYSALQRKRTRIAALLRQRGADELSKELANGLAISIALQDALDGLGKPLPNLRPEENFRSRWVASVDSAAARLMAEGKVEQARTLELYRNRMIVAVDSTPREDGMSMLDWAKVVASRAGNIVAATQSGEK